VSDAPVTGAAPQLSGERLAEFVAELRDVLQAATPTGYFSVILPANVLRLWRPPPS